MRKISSFAAAALILAGLGGWIASTTHARVEAPVTAVSIDPSQIMKNAHDLPVAEEVDHGFVFH
jgi:hypothetical protein